MFLHEKRPPNFITRIYIERCVHEKPAIKFYIDRFFHETTAIKYYIERCFAWKTGHQIVYRYDYSGNNRPSNVISRGFLMKTPSTKFYIVRFFHEETLYREVFWWTTCHPSSYRDLVSVNTSHEILYREVLSWCKRPSNCITRGFCMKETGHQIIYREVWMLGALLVSAPPIRVCSG